MQFSVHVVKWSETNQYYVAVWYAECAVQDSSTGSLLCLSLVLSKTLQQGHYCVYHLCCQRLFNRVITVSVTCAVQDSSTVSLLLLSLVCPRLFYRVITVSVACVVQDFSTGSLLHLSLVCSRLHYRVITVSATCCNCSAVRLNGQCGLRWYNRQDNRKWQWIVVR
jgi:hypothetical protein